jgi:hypothetical protein
MREKRFLCNLLLPIDDRRLGAFPTIWQLQAKYDDAGFQEELLHQEVEKREPVYENLIQAIRAYEAFARSLQDAFDILKAEAARVDIQGFLVPEIDRDEEFEQCVADLHQRFAKAYDALGEVSLASLSLQNLFGERFKAFDEPMDGGRCALALCEHHEAVQRAKSADGKRPWFDRIGRDRIYIRHAYREPRRDIQPGSYVHDYRGCPIRRFYSDLS